MKKEYIIIGAVVLTIGYFVWRNNQKTNGNGGGVNNGTILDGKYPKQIDVSKIKTVSGWEGMPMMSYDKYTVFMGNNDKKQEVIYLNDGSSGGASAIYDKTTGIALGYTFILSGHAIFNYFSDIKIPNTPTTNTATCPNGNSYDPNAQYDTDPCADSGGVFWEDKGGNNCQCITAPCNC
jgi:hypothetical protein